MLNATLRALRSPSPPAAGLTAFITWLESRRAQLGAADWQRQCDLVRSHPLHRLLLEDPLTQRAFTRQRGQPGDAVLMDLIYRHTDAQYRVDTASPAGQSLLSELLEQPLARGMRERRYAMAHAIDSVGVYQRHPRVLSVGCGHARETEASQAIRSRWIGKFVGLDPDPAALRGARRGLPEMTCIEAGADVLLNPDFDIGRFDLIYAASLYDDLDQRSAQQMTRALFDRLNPGGDLFIAAVRAGNALRGYMEAVMNWVLIHRTEQEVADLLSLIPAERHERRRLRLDSSKSIVMLSVTRAP